MRKIIFIATCFFLVCIVIFIFAWSSKKQTAPTIQPPQNSNTAPTIVIPQTQTITISGTPFNNFYKNAAKIDKQGDVYIVNEPQKYQIIYFQQFNSFMISITGSPFEQFRQEAEKILIDKTGMSQEQLCTLNVSTTTPSFANPDFAGKNYPLSFCQK